MTRPDYVMPHRPQHASPAAGNGPPSPSSLLPLLLVSMDVSVLFFAVPFIAADLQPTATQQLWIFDIYGFVLAGLLLTMGSLGDRIGRRKLLLIGAAAFGMASRPRRVRAAAPRCSSPPARCSASPARP